MSRGPARRADSEPCGTPQGACNAWRTPEYAERSAPVLGRAERTPERSGRCSGAETPDAACFRIASRFGLPHRKPRFSSASKTGSSRPPKAQADARCGPKTGGEWPQCPPENPTMKDRRRRGRAISIRFRPGAAEFKRGAQAFRFTKHGIRLH
jgi:hypothetical protein